MRDIVDSGGMMKYESIQFFFRKHWTYFLRPLFFGITVMLLTFFIFLVAGTIITVFSITFLYAVFAFIVIIVSIFIINTFFLQLFNFFFDAVIVTNYRIMVVHKTVFLKNDNNAIDLTKIQDFGVISRGILRNYLNYGALIITLSTSMPPIIIRYVPNPHYYLEQMNKVKRAYIIERQERRGGAEANSAKNQDYLRDIDKLQYGS